MKDGDLATPRVLVLMSVRNGRTWLREQIESILSQRGVRVRLVIADDASTDGSFEALQALFGHLDTVCIMRWPRPAGSLGASFIRLFGAVDLAREECVALADQDGIWHPDKLLAAVARLYFQNAAGYSCAVRAFWPDGSERTLRLCPRPTRADFLFEGAGQGASYVFRAEYFRAIQAYCRSHPGLVGAMHSCEWLIYLLFRAWSLRWYFDEVPWLRGRQYGGGEGLGLARQLALFRSGWYRRQVVAAGRIYAAAGGVDPLVLTLASRMEAPRRAAWDRLAVLVEALQHGRRRWRDRLWLAGGSFVGWL